MTSNKHNINNQLFKNMQNQVGKRIKELRTALKLSQEKFASQAGLSSSGVTKVELGAIPASSDFIEKVHETWDVPLEWLESGKGKMSFNKNGAPKNIYQDALYKELKEDKEDWKQKYNQLFEMFNKVLDRGQLGKYKPTELTAGRVLSSRRPVAEAYEC